MLKTKLKRSYLLPALIIIIAAAAIAALVVGEDKPKKPAASAKNTTSACGSYRDDLNVKIGGQTFKTELAKSSQEFQKGLGGRTCIKPDHAMMFAFTKEGQYKFWMKDMKFPIDIIWINSSHRVAALEIDVQPSTYHSSSPYFENDPRHLARYVLEVQANRSKQLHINLGTPVTL